MPDGPPNTISAPVVPAAAPAPSSSSSAAPTTAPPGGLTGGLAGMHPAYFAMVMATGIVSIACWLLELRVVGRGLFWLNLAFYAALWVLTGLRLARHPARVAGDFAHHGRSVGFFTTVAATCVLGSQCLVIAGAWRAAAAFWVAGIVLWAGLVYSIFTVLTVKPLKPSLAEGINGGWLVSVVAAQSVCVLGRSWPPASTPPPGRACCCSAWRCGSAAGCSTSGSSR